MKTVTSTVFNAVKTVISTVWNTVKSIVTGAAKAVWTTVKNNFNNMKKAVSTVMDAVKGTVKRLWDSAVNIFKNTNLLTIGKNIIQGLANGIGSMAGYVWKKAGDIANGIKSKLKGLLGIHSPSRWMRDNIGKMIPAGVAVGIDKAGGLVTKATNKMAELAMFTPDQTQFAYDAAISGGDLSRVQHAISAEVSDFEIPDQPIIVEMDGKEVGRGVYKYVKNFQSREDGRRTTIRR